MTTNKFKNPKRLEKLLFVIVILAWLTNCSMSPDSKKDSSEEVVDSTSVAFTIEITDISLKTTTSLESIVATGSYSQLGTVTIARLE